MAYYPHNRRVNANGNEYSCECQKIVGREGPFTPESRNDYGSYTNDGNATKKKFVIRLLPTWIFFPHNALTMKRTDEQRAVASES